MEQHLALLIVILGGVVFTLIAGTRSQWGWKQCPFCRYSIPGKATICRFCRTPQPKGPQ